MNGSAREHAHVTSVRVYLLVWLALMCGTALTITAAFIDLGPFNVALMLAIAVAQASLVALFFMHLAHDDKFNAIVFVTAILFVIVFFAFTLIDPLTRGTVNPIERHPIAPEMDRAGSYKSMQSAGDADENPH